MKNKISDSNLKNWLESLTKDHRPDFEECLEMLGNIFSLLYEFSNTPQDKIWHAEGDVAVHTQMVLTQLYNLFDDELTNIEGWKKQSLILSALLHDIAKPLVTKNKDINGLIRVVAPKHEEIGKSYLALRLMVVPLDYRVIHTILGLVGYHQIPKLLVIKNKDYSDYLSLSLNADLELLYWLEMADMKGRVCPDLDLQLELLEQFKMFSIEYKLWSNTDLISSILTDIQSNQEKSEQLYIENLAISQLANGAIKSISQAFQKNYEASKNHSNFYIMCGISASGKSTWIKNNLKGFEVISLDEIREEINGKRSNQKNRGQMLQIAKQRLKTALAKKKNVVWDATNIRKDYRNILYDIGNNYQALMTLVVFQIDSNTLHQNNNGRKHEVDKSVINKQIGQLQWPDYSEFHRIKVIGDHGLELYKQGIF